VTIVSADAAIAAGSSGSARRAELLASAYNYVLEHGLARLSLRPLAAAIGTSPRVLLYLFDSKEGMIRELLARAREEQLALVRANLAKTEIRDLDDVIDVVWHVLAAPQRRRLVGLIYEAFIMAVQPDPGPWDGFATEQVNDWLTLLQDADPDTTTPRTAERATRALALIRGLLLDLLATDDHDRIARAFP